MTDVIPTPVVAQQAELESLGRHLASCAQFAIDTEFLRERTYRAELCLVQVATREQVTAVDPLAGLALAPLARALESSAEKVMHAGRQDLEVLLPLAASIAPIFDTQVAAALAGFPAQVGYAELVRRVLGVELAKAHTRTDWSRRPLSAEQIAYAHDDVRYLLPLRDALELELERRGRGAWLAQELAALADPSAITVKPEDAWRRIKGLAELDAPRRMLAQRLAAWRELRAVERNRPRGWILSDISLRDIVLRVPRSIAELASVSDIAAGFVSHSGAQILAIIRDSGIPDPPPPPPPRKRAAPGFTDLVKKLGSIVQARAAELELTSEVLATRRDLEQIAHGRKDVPPLEGWRREVIGEQLLATL
jgi:ribonuclease D